MPDSVLISFTFNPYSEQSSKADIITPTSQVRKRNMAQKECHLLYATQLVTDGDSGVHALVYLTSSLTK